MEIIDCKIDGKSFCLDVDDDPTPEIQEAADIMETRSSARTTRESRTSLYKCKDEEETGKHQKLCTLLCRYGQSRHFGQYLSSHGFKLTPTHLRTLSTDDLEDMLTRCRSCVNGKDTSNWMEEAIFGLLKTGEILCSNSPIDKKFKIAGLTEALRQDESFTACLEILQLENSDYTQLPAHYRLLWSIVAAAMKQNAINTFIQKRGLVPQKENEVKLDDSKVDKEKEYVEEPTKDNVLDFN